MKTLALEREIEGIASDNTVTLLEQEAEHSAARQ